MNTAQPHATGLSRRRLLGAAASLSLAGSPQAQALLATTPAPTLGWRLWFGAIDAIRRPAHLAAWMGHAQGMVATPLQVQPGHPPALHAQAGGEPLARWLEWAEQAALPRPRAAAAQAQALDAQVARLATPSGRRAYLGPGERLPLAPFLEGAGLTVDTAAAPEVVEDEAAHALRRLLVVQPLPAWQTLLRLRSVPLLSPLEPTEIPRALHTARRRWLASVSAAAGTPSAPHPVTA
ncbi:hypothetical protein [Roseateles paludis]|jgi:hypothetical protein|uniref:Uncharacterized protein n=1 Tax=Roseateles paludis TaxID=3145238 RepID=A0ABV0G3M5_9BURK